MESKEEGAEEQAFEDARISIHFVKQTKVVGKDDARFERIKNQNLMLLWWLTFLTNVEERILHLASWQEMYESVMTEESRPQWS